MELMIIFLLLIAFLLTLLLQLLEKDYLPLPDFHGLHKPAGKPRGGSKALLTEPAVLVRKTTETAADDDGVEYTNLLLEFDTGSDLLPCYVTGRVYRQTQEGMEGLLTHQGTTFKCFEVGGVKIEK